MKRALFLSVVGIAGSLLAAESPLKPVKITASSYVVFEGKRATKHDPGQVADGKLDNHNCYWTTDFRHQVKPPHWLEFDFGRPVTFSAIKLDMVERYNFSVILNNFKLEYFDGQTYRTLVNCPRYRGDFFVALNSRNFKKRYLTPMLDSHPVFTFPAVTGTKVRLTCRDGIARLDEMSVFVHAPARPTVEVAKQPGSAIERDVQMFSFAPETSPLPAGFKRAPLTHVDGVYQVDRQYPDSVRRFIAASEKDNSMIIPVAQPGFYEVFAISGEEFARNIGCTIWVNGKKMQLTAEPHGNFPWQIITVKADKNIRVNLKAPWAINALIVAPVEKHAVFEQVIDQVIVGDRVVKFKKDVPATHTTPVPANSVRGRSWIAYQPKLDQRIFPRTTPRQDQITSVVRGQAATGTTPALSVAFYATRHLNNFKVEYQGQLKAQLFPIRVWLQRSDRKSNVKLYGWLPEILQDNAAQFIRKNTSLQYYLIFDLPAGTKAGNYRGNLKITADGIKPFRLPVQFKVLPFTLEPLDHVQYAAMYFQNQHLSFLSHRHTALDRQILQDMRRHNMNSIIYPNSRWQGKAAFEKQYLHVNAELDRAGFPRNLMAWGNRKVNRQIVQDVLDVVKKHNLREMVFYPVDEPRFGRQEIAMKLYPLIKSVPGARTYSTISQDDIDLFGKYLDFRTFMITDYAKFEPDRIRAQAQREKAHFWWYSNAAREYPDVCRFKAGFFTYRCGSTGQLYWCYTNPRDDAWNDCDGTEHDHSPVYFIGNKIYSTIEWEAIREGLDDLRYISLLEKAIARHPRREEAVKSRQLLNRIKQDTPVDLELYRRAFGRALAIHDKCFWSPEKFASYRAQIIDAIIKLKE